MPEPINPLIVEHASDKNLEAELEQLSDLSFDPDDMAEQSFTNLDEPCEFMHHLWQTGVKRHLAQF